MLAFLATMGGLEVRGKGKGLEVAFPSGVPSDGVEGYLESTFPHLSPLSRALIYCVTMAGGTVRWDDLRTCFRGLRKD